MISCFTATLISIEERTYRHIIVLGPNSMANSKIGSYFYFACALCPVHENKTNALSDKSGLYRVRTNIVHIHMQNFIRSSKKIWILEKSFPPFEEKLDKKTREITCSWNVSLAPLLLSDPCCMFSNCFYLPKNHKSCFEKNIFIFKNSRGIFRSLKIA